jgi:ISXO2-like transposase domain/Transposase zinc-ribbon domain
MAIKKEPYGELSVLEFFKRFPDEATCWTELVRLRWPKGKACPECGKPMGFVQTRRLFQCRPCRKQVSATAGTMFHQSHLPLHKWFWAIFMMATPPKGVSMRYLQKQLGIKSYRTAWLLGHKIRRAMIQREGLYQLKGKVQVDQIKIGTQSLENRREIREDRNSQFLMSVQEGTTKDYPRFVSFEELASGFKKDVLPALEKRVAKGSTLKTDAAGVFGAAAKKGYEVEQSSFSKEPDKTKEHLKWVHWLSSNLKRGLVSTYHGCFPKYRKAYLAEFAYRFNRRYWPYQVFDRLLVACIQAKSATLKEIKI